MQGGSSLACQVISVVYMRLTSVWQVKAEARKFIESLRKNHDAAAQDLRSKIHELTALNQELAAKIEVAEDRHKSVSDELCKAQEETAKVSFYKFLNLILVHRLP